MTKPYKTTQRLYKGCLIKKDEKRGYKIYNRSGLNIAWESTLRGAKWFIDSMRTI